jgi:hypothetical protein
MSGFFDSEVVRESMSELDELQEQLFVDMLRLPLLDVEEKRDHLKMMTDFLEKQKLFIFRLSLSDDPKAIEMKEKVLDSAKMLGLKKGQTINDFYDMMQKTIDGLKETLDD